MTTFERWRAQFRIIRILADQQERIELALCETVAEKLARAADRQRVESISPSLSHQVWGMQP